MNVSRTMWWISRKSLVSHTEKRKSRCCRHRHRRYEYVLASFDLLRIVIFLQLYLHWKFESNRLNRTLRRIYISNTMHHIDTLWIRLRSNFTMWLIECNLFSTKSNTKCVNEIKFNHRSHIYIVLRCYIFVCMHSSCHSWFIHIICLPCVHSNMFHSLLLTIFQRMCSDLVYIFSIWDVHLCMKYLCEVLVQTKCDGIGIGIGIWKQNKWTIISDLCFFWSVIFSSCSLYIHK